MLFSHNKYKTLDSDDQLPDEDNAKPTRLNHAFPKDNSLSRSSLWNRSDSSVYELIKTPNIQTKEYVAQSLVRALILLIFKDQVTMLSKGMTPVFKISNDMSGRIESHFDPQKGLDGFYAQFRRSGGGRIALVGV